MKFRIIFALLGICLVAGCLADKEKIVFSDEAITRPAETNVVVAPAPELSQSDELEIRATIFGYLISRHFWDNGDYAAIFIQGKDTEVEALKNKFPNHVPPIKPGYQAEMRDDRAPLDLATGEPAMVLSADVGELNADGTVDALGKWFAGDAVTGFYTFELKRIGGEWEIESVK